MGFLQNITGGLAGNMREVTPDEADAVYGPWLMDAETLTGAYRLLRDGFAISNQRLLFMDRQGVTGTKTRMFSIPLSAIVAVTAETAGAGIDDSEMTLTYISSAHHHGYSVRYDTYRVEFPKSFPLHGLYRYFATLAHQNVERLNAAGR